MSRPPNPRHRPQPPFPPAAGASSADAGLPQESEPDLDDAFAPDGVDLTLIRWMLELTPTERLRAAQSWIDDATAARASRDD
jgi:hypothetical protein